MTELKGVMYIVTGGIKKIICGNILDNVDLEKVISNKNQHIELNIHKTIERKVI